MYKKIYFTFLVAILAVPLSQAAAPAFDSASDVVYDAPGGWAAGDNGGFGFLPWIMPGASVAPFFQFMGSSVVNGDGLDDGLPLGVLGDGDINTPSAGGPRAWGLLAVPPAGLSEAFRPFAAAPLLPGETFSINMDNGFVAAGGAAGFGLLSAGVARFEFFAGPAGYTVMDAAGFTPAPVPFTTEGLTIAFTLVTPGTYTITVTPFGLPPIVSPVLVLAAGGGIDTVRIFDFSSGAGGGPADIYFNNMSIIPEPTTVTLVGLALAGLLAVRRRSA